MRTLLTGAGVALIARIMAAVATFLIAVLISNSMPLTESGLFFLGLAICSLGVVIGKLGFDHSIVRVVAAEADQGGRGAVWRVYRQALARVALFSFLLLALISGALFSAVYVFSLPKTYAFVLSVMSVGIPLLALTHVQAEVMRGVGAIGWSSFFLMTFVPTVFVFSLMYVDDNSALKAAVIYVLSCLLALVVSYIFVRRCLAGVPEKKASFLNGGVRLFSASLWLVSFLSAFNQSIAQLMLGVFGLVDQVAFFSASQRVAVVIGFCLMAFNAVLGPKFARLYHDGRFEDVARLTRYSLISLWIFGFPIFIIVFSFSKEILGFFGNQFVGAHDVLIILAFGQLVNLVTGPVGTLLVMSGNESLMRLSLVLSVLLNCACSLLLVPFFSVVGTAVAALFGVLLQNCLGVMFVAKRLNINVFKVWV
ncbi:polysaccharide biosynthesis C-terminal domain-containing protein [Marinobacter sp. JSM 1782161]|uniref:oligosaccharide flippase family protein n=1 Tax=Marinobacter sp. JSM 1782161 TaxID=2685906 RepID=UPI00140202CA|nr:oligosaccharide flippase family protein [Marinobacter sp. JSM 1782161]